MAFNFIQDLLTSGNDILNNDNEHSDSESDFEEDVVDSLDRSMPSSSGSDSETEPQTANSTSTPDGILWSDRLHPVDIQEFSSHSGPTHHLDPDGDTRPIDYFNLFIKDSFFDDLARETNLYAEQRMAADGKRNTSWVPVRSQDMKAFIYINIMFGIHTMPQLYMYWSTDELLKVPAVADVMSRNRFRDISRYLHLHDNDDQVPRGEDGHDPLFKIRPLHDMVLEACRTCFAPSQAISFDEAMIAFKGRLYFKQYIKGKPNPWGVKVWCAADSSTGYLLNFSFYTGKETTTTNKDGLGYRVVMDLGEQYLGQFHHFYFDNFFSSVKLAEDLLHQKTYSCATIRTNRKGWPADLKSKKQKKDTTLMKQRGNLVACLWQDKRTVCLLSTNSDPEMAMAQRKTKEGIVDRQIPKSVLSYNSNMGGVDLNDQLRSYYPIGRKSKKWWRCTLWYLFEVAAVNAFIVYKTSTTRVGQKPMTHVQFQLEIARELLRGNVVRSHRAKEFPSVSGLGKAAPQDHGITRLVGRKRQCFQCRVEGKKTTSNRVPETVYGCPTCNTHLCKGHCFAKFHNNLN